MRVSVKCSGCGEPAVWAVTLPYDRGQRPGRLLAYCDRDREDKNQTILVAIPLDFLTDDVFVGLYRDGWTASEPEFASEIVFGITRHELVHEVRRYLKESD